MTDVLEELQRQYMSQRINQLRLAALLEAHTPEGWVGEIELHRESTPSRQVVGVGTRREYFNRRVVWRVYIAKG